MGIYSAMGIAVSGLKAQSFALEHISGNLANSQTVGFKRTETAFADLVPKSPYFRQISGGVEAYTRGTNSVQGDVRSADVPTFMGINGNGFFIVESQVDQSDGMPVFGGVDLYTRRGDFELDRNGFMVNGSNYYLKAIRVDPQTGNLVGSLPEAVRITNDFLPARETTQITLRANLASYPQTADADPNQPGSELLRPTSFGNDPTADGDGFVRGADTEFFLEQSIAGGAITVYDTGGAPVNLQFRWAKTDSASAVPRQATWSVAGEDIDDYDGQILSVNGTNYTIDSNGGPHATWDDFFAAVNAGENANGIFVDVNGDDITIRSENFGERFELSGNVATDFEVDGEYNSADQWNLFYLENSNASGNMPAWRNVGETYMFNANGQMMPQIPSVDLNNVTVNGAAIAETVVLNHGDNGLTQFADPNGTAQMTEFRQNGYAAGELQGVSISESGRVIATYTNGRTVDLYQVQLASFNAPNRLEKLDGGAFAATQDSGPPIAGAQGTIIGAALEGSNTDIADEFTKMIVTQQAYSAGTRVVTTGSEMLQEVLNMVR
jgi:flagellar hook protein FlgE